MSVNNTNNLIYIFVSKTICVETYEIKFIIKISLAMNEFFSMFHTFDWILPFFAVNWALFVKVVSNQAIMSLL